MSHLAKLESSFAHALLDVGGPLPHQVRASPRRFAVYRNNVAMGLYTALSARYPVVKRLVGDDFFRELCRLYVAAEPPRSPILLYYGETFPAFIDAFEPARAIPYLGAVAQIELARGLAYHAADMDVLDGKTFAAIDPAKFPELRVALHPSVSVIESAFPIYSIWKVNQNKAPVVPVSPWASEAVLVVRPQYAVQVYKLERGQASFLQALLAGRPFAEAAAAGFDDTSDFDPVEAVALLIRAKLAVGVDQAKSISIDPTRH